MIPDKAWHHHLPGLRLTVDADAICEVIYRSGSKETGYCSQLNWTDAERYRVIDVAKDKPDDAGQDI